MNSARMLLTRLRGGDYAHAGDREAIELVAKDLIELSPSLYDSPCLDVGCGFGGTADALRQIGFEPMYGLDIDEAAIAYAKSHYPEVEFVMGDARNASKFFDKGFFYFQTLFNVFYAIENKRLALKELGIVAKTGALLALFDYTAKKDGLELKDLAGKPMRLMSLKALEVDLRAAGWKLVETTDLTERFIAWYRATLAKLDENREELLSEFSSADVERVETTFTKLLEWLEDGSMGGALVMGRKC